MERITRRQVLRDGAGAGLALGLSGSLLAACGSGSTGGSSTAANVSPTTRIPATPYNPNLPAGAKPNLPRRIGYVYPAQAQFWTMMFDAMQRGGSDAKIDVLSADSNADANKSVQQMNAFLTRGIAALFAVPVDPQSTIALQKQAIDKGVLVLATSGVQPPTTQSFTADQYLVGKAQGEAAARWIKERLGGRANVAYLEDFQTIPALKPRSQAVLDALAKVGPGITYIAKQQPRDESSQNGFQLMNTVLQAHPDVDVVLAADSIAIGALAAIQAAGKVKPNLYVAGINGDAEALRKVEEGGPYRASIAFPFALIGYASARYTADWLDGKSIPLVLNTNPIVLTSKAEIDRFTHDTAVPNLSATYERMPDYFDMRGNISYATRGKYLEIGL